MSDEHGAGPAPEINAETEFSNNNIGVFAQKFIPATIKARKQWLGWKWGERDGNRTKIPVNPLDGRNTDAPAAAWTFDDALRGLSSRLCDGVGFSQGRRGGDRL